jgi:hypothetical protein
MSVHGNPGRWLAGLLLALTASLVLAQGAPWVVKAVHGYRIALAPARSDEAGRFEGVVRLSTKGAHRILIHATPAGGGRTLEAQFEYRLHH